MYDSSEDFIFFVLKLTNFEDSGAENLPRYRRIYSINDETPYSYYLCDPINYDSVRATISKANKIYSSSIPMYFQHYTDDSESQTNIQVNSTFAIWPATVDISQPVEGSLSDIEKLNCVLISNT